MPYATKADILEQLDEDILVQLTDDTDMGVVGEDAVVRAIADADAVIDGYCGTRYAVPFTDVPVIIRKLAVDIAIYNLYARRKGAPEDRKARHENAVKLLRDVSLGKITLGGDAPAEDTDSGPEVTTKKSDRIFSTGKSSDGSAGTLDNY